MIITLARSLGYSLNFLIKNASIAPSPEPQTRASSIDMRRPATEASGQRTFKDYNNMYIRAWNGPMGRAGTDNKLYYFDIYI